MGATAYDVITEFTNGKLIVCEVKALSIVHCISKLLNEAFYTDELSEISDIDISTK